MNLLRLILIIALAPLLSTCHRPVMDGKKMIEDVAHKEKVAMVNRFLQHYESKFSESLSRAGCPGAAIAVVVDSSVVWVKGFGVKSASTGELVNEHTLFRLGSLSKGISAILVSKLVHQGKMSWTDRVIDYIHPFTMADSSQASRISISHLLSHSTGLPRHTFTNLIEDGLNTADLVNRLSKVPIIGREGKVFAYQNFAFSLIEQIVQEKTSLSFSDLLRSEIFGPAMMNDANTNKDSYIASGNYAKPHRPAGTNKFTEIPLNGKYYNAVSAGGINASISDMSEWLQLLLGQKGNVVSGEMLEDVFQPVVSTHAENRFRHWSGLKESYYALGWRVMELADRKIIYHGGSVNDFRTEIAIDPVSHIGICVLFNGQNNMAGKVVPQFLEMYRDSIH